MNLTGESAKLYGFNTVPRDTPTVATTTNPVVDKTVASGLEYDLNNPEDYLMRLNARMSTT